MIATVLRSHEAKSVSRDPPLNRVEHTRLGWINAPGEVLKERLRSVGPKRPIGSGRRLPAVWEIGSQRRTSLDGNRASEQATHLRDKGSEIWESALNLRPR